MIKTKIGVLIALITPIIMLCFLYIYKKHTLSVGKKVVLPISGHNVIDSLSGYHLVYKIDYKIPDICNNHKNYEVRTSYICLKPKKFSYDPPNNCDVWIKGACNRGLFKANIERYYVSEKAAKKLKKNVKSKKASIVISVYKNGKAQVKDLLIDGVSFKKTEVLKK